MIMKTKFFAVFAAAVLVLVNIPGFAADTSSASSDLKELVTRIQAKLKSGPPTEAGLAPELKEFDTLLAKYQGKTSDDVAQILMMKASLYSQVLKNEAKGAELFAQLKRDFPDSKPVAMLKQQEESEKMQSTLVAGAKFPDFEEKDTTGKALSVATYKGKVLLLDFWATWCGPCVAELPNVLKTYEKHHGAGFEIIGVSLDNSKDKLDNFTKEKKMTWPQFFDGKGWQNKLAQQYGIRSIPATFLLDGNGVIIAKNLRGPDLEEAVAKALLKK
jgi:peroxiredoxin